MTEEEREQERREIVERFGANVGDVLRRARLARDKQHEPKEVPQPMHLESDSGYVAEGIHVIAFSRGLHSFCFFQMPFQ